jgi:hypothetical protein
LIVFPPEGPIHVVRVMKNLKDRIAFHVFWVSALLLVFSSGMLIGWYRLFPCRVISLAEDGFKQLRTQTRNDGLDWLCVDARDSSQPPTCQTPLACDGLNLVTRVKGDCILSANVLDMDGASLHEWTLDWFKIWPDAKHLPANFRPQMEPGTSIDGAVLLENGNLVFNFEHLGLVCVDFDGNVVWRLPYQTHHNITRGDGGNLWVCGQVEHTKRTNRLPNWIPPFTEDTLLEITPEGKIVNEWSVVDILRKNDKEGLLYLGSTRSFFPTIGGDVLHLNDVEPFRADVMKEGFFKKGDVLVSLRNINTIFVFNRETEKIKFIHTGSFVRQHDPDFVDGNTVSVFDNRTLGENDKSQSRILLISAPDQTVKVLYEGTPEHPFFTNIMGKHQWLPNGDLLITEARNGRAFEIDSKGKIVWEHHNYIKKGQVGLVTEVSRLPPAYARLFGNSRLHTQALQAAGPRQDKSTATKPNGGLTR